MNRSPEHFTHHLHESSKMGVSECSLCKIAELEQLVADQAAACKFGHCDTGKVVTQLERQLADSQAAIATEKQLHDAVVRSHKRNGERINGLVAERDALKAKLEAAVGLLHRHPIAEGHYQWRQDALEFLDTMKRTATEAGGDQ